MSSLASTHDHSRTVADFFGAQSRGFRENYQRSRDFRARFEIWSGLIDSYAAKPGVAVALDLGCGPGLMAFHAAARGLRVFGVDLSKEMIDMCLAEKAERHIENADFLVAPLPLDADVNLPVADIALSSSVLEYVPDIDATIRSIGERLRPGGFFIVSLPNQEAAFRRYERLRQSLGIGSKVRGLIRNVFTMQEAEKLFLKHGFETLEHTYYGDEPRLSRVASLIAPDRFSKNLFVMVLRKKS